jgi:hypothetical protein
MIGHKLPNKTKSATVAAPKLFHQLNNPLDKTCGYTLDDAALLMKYTSSYRF